MLVRTTTPFFTLKELLPADDERRGTQLLLPVSICRVVVFGVSVMSVDANYVYTAYGLKCLPGKMD